MTAQTRFFLSILLFTLLAPTAGSAGPYFSFASPDDSIAVQDLVRKYLTYSQAEPIPTDSIRAYAADELEERLQKSFGVPLRFPERMPYAITAVRSLRSDGSAAVIVASANVDSLPWHGQFVLDWVFFARKVDSAGWRLSALRRQKGVEDAVEQVRYLDTSSVYPASLKPVVAREMASVLLSNEGLRANFRDRRALLDRLARNFRGRDSLSMLARTDKVPVQINNFAIVWGAAAYEVPKKAREEFMALLTSDERVEMQAQFRAMDKMYRAGRDTLKNIARKLRTSVARLDTVVGLMHDSRVTYVTNQLPWKGAVQFTVGGSRDDVIGYIYSPSGELPYLSPEEYFYLEELDGGWWLFRAT